MLRKLRITWYLGITGVVSVAATPSEAQVGPLIAWGNNSVGQLQVPAGNFSRVSACGTFSVAIREDGTLWAWGASSMGQLENLPAGNTFVDVSAGAFGGVALRADGTLASWGYDEWGQVSQTPSGTFSAIAGADSFRLARRTTGELVAWGRTTGSVPQGTFLDFDGGSNFGLAIRTDGTLVGWGDPVGGSINVPPGTYVAVEAGMGFGAAIATDGSLRSWGTILTPGGSGPMPPPPPGNDFVDIDAGVSNYVIARRANGTLVAWGGSAFGGEIVPTGSFIDMASAHAHGVAIVPSPGSLTLGSLIFVLGARRARKAR